MHRSITEIRERLTLALESRGIAKEDASLLAEEYLEGELEGKQSHGLMAFPSLLKTIRGPLAEAETILKTHALLVLEANGTPGIIVGKKAIGILAGMAQEEGVAVAIIKNMASWLRPGSIARMVAEMGMVGLAVNNGGKAMVAPPGGFDPVIGTNPIGIGIPTTEDPIVVDMATSKRAWGEVRKAKREGLPLPEGTYYADDGQFTTDPEQAISVEATGEYKGFGLALFIEILTGSLVGKPMGSHADTEPRQRKRNALIAVFDPSKTCDPLLFTRENSALIAAIKDTRRLEGNNEILMPGERAAIKRKGNLDRGTLEIEDALWEQLQ